MRRRWCWWCCLASFVCSELVVHGLPAGWHGTWPHIACYVALSILFDRVHHDDDDRKKRRRVKDQAPDAPLVAPAMTREGGDRG